MQQLQNASERATARAAAKALMDVTPRMTFIIRELAYRHRTRSVSFPQLRVLALVHKVPCADLSFIARHLSLSLSAASRLVEHLVSKRLLLRTTPADNRRKIALTLTPGGKKVLEKTTRAVEKDLAVRLADMPEQSRRALVEAMGLMRGLCAASCREE